MMFFSFSCSPVSLNMMSKKKYNAICFYTREDKQQKKKTEEEKYIYINEVVCLLINPTKHFLTCVSHVEKSIVILKN
jgi:hypothetical protein